MSDTPEQSERIASLETRQEGIERQTSELREGQKEILDKLDDLDDQYVEEERLSKALDRFEEVESEVETNTTTRVRAKTTAKIAILTLTIAGGFSGAAVALM